MAVVAREPADPLAGFNPAVRAWFGASFEAPTAAQTTGWASIGAGRSTLLLAPTGSGKTLAAFLAVIDRLMFSPSNKTARVSSIESWSTPSKPVEGQDGQSVGVMLDDQLFLERGELASHEADARIARKSVV